NDGLFVWHKGLQQSEILSGKEWALLPAEITVRIIRFTATIRKGHSCQSFQMTLTRPVPIL
ncbi:MAG: hypothetical protein ABSC18_16810, partial [Verrucomicrobiota bacterium]